MFMDKILISKPNDIRYGTTKMPFSKTYGQVMELLQKHGCTKIMTMQDGNLHKIAFEFQEKPYIITIPRVYVKGEYDDRIGIRLVLYYLQILLDWSKERVIDFEFIMLGSRIVNVGDHTLSVKDAVERLPPGQLFGPVTPMEVLPGKAIDVEGKTVEEK